MSEPWVPSEQEDDDRVFWSTVRDDDGDFYYIDADGQNKFIPPPVKPIVLLPYVSVETVDQVRDMVNALGKLPKDHEDPHIGFDLEASNLGHDSALALMQIRDYENEITYIVDTLLLRENIWDTADDGGLTLRALFEDHATPKIIWDCRADSCCLFGQFDIRLQGVIDVQILHLLMSPYEYNRGGLAKGVSQIAQMNRAELLTWNENKDRSEAHGHWHDRPLADEQLSYAIGDVIPLKKMFESAKGTLNEFARDIERLQARYIVKATWVTAEEWTGSDGDSKAYVGIHLYELLHRAYTDKVQLLQEGKNSLASVNIKPLSYEERIDWDKVLDAHAEKQAQEAAEVGSAPSI